MKEVWGAKDFVWGVGFVEWIGWGNQAVCACVYMILDCMHAARRISYYGVRKFQERGGE